MCVVAGFALLFIGGAGWNLLHGDTDNATWGFITGVVLGLFAYAMAREENETQEFLAFLVENEAALSGGASVQYRGTTVSPQTEVTQFFVCVSFLILTTRLPSRFYIRGSHNTFGLGSLYSLVSLVFGWWGLPFGPIYTLQSLYKNLRGGEKKLISRLITEIERVEPAQPTDNPTDNPKADNPNAKTNALATAPPESPWSSSS